MDAGPLKRHSSVTPSFLSSRISTSQQPHRRMRSRPEAAPGGPVPTILLRHPQAEILQCFLLPWGKVKSSFYSLIIDIFDPF